MTILRYASSATDCSNCSDTVRVAWSSLHFRSLIRRIICAKHGSPMIGWLLGLKLDGYFFWNLVNSRLSLMWTESTVASRGSKCFLFLQNLVQALRLSFASFSSSLKLLHFEWHFIHHYGSSICTMNILLSHCFLNVYTIMLIVQVVFDLLTCMCLVSGHQKQSS